MNPVKKKRLGVSQPFSNKENFFTRSRLIASFLDPNKRRPKPKPEPTWVQKTKKASKVPESQLTLDSTYGFVVLQGDHHTIARGTIQNYEIVFDKYVAIANKHGHGGQSQNRFMRLAEQSRVLHLKIILERLAEIFLDEENKCLVEKVIVAGPGPMKLQLLEHLPKRWVEIIDPNPITIDHVGLVGMQQLAEILT
ncbi:eukaryotic peptide chain release factor subunit 1-like [Penaeus monodon]|uniref:eukaryotic peptide chain release factor subunit 1-like n=1 Tax=Penaeus monodon TaxID=6687 RepID=UPI0018A7D6DA|nr:eukaryotic peptide chain release factor subunit 1-like [Penaeus monodon]